MKKCLIHSLLLTAMFCLLKPAQTCGQEDRYPQYPGDDFRAPLEIPLRLSGSFGELRGNHFHSGIDFKTLGRTGIPLYAAARGHIARIKVSASGFGKALYIRHPNGFTTVYAHIARFNDEIADFVERVQYQRKTYELNLFPNENQFRLEKGDLIAYSGNSGSSAGPHLHFEVRETRTEKPVNPLFFGFDVTDSRKPVIQGVRLYPLGRNSRLKVRLDHRQDKQVISQGEAVTLDVGKKDNAFAFTDVEELCAVGEIGVGIEVYDYHNGSTNPLGVYRITLKDQQGTIFQSTIDKFPFAQTRFINAHIDYAANVRFNDDYQRCYVLPGNKLPFYETRKNGKITVSAKQTPELKMTIADPYGNQSTLEWDLNYLEEADAPEPVGKASSEYTVFPYDQVNTIEKEGIKLRFPPGTFYDTVHFTLNKEPASASGRFSPVYQVQDRYTPVQRYYTIAIDASGVPMQYHDKALIAYAGQSGRISAEGGTYQNGYITTKTRELGAFHVSVDTVPPRVEPLNFKKGTGFSGDVPMRIMIDDELAGIAEYTPKINGRWMRMAYDAKNDLLLFEDFHRLKKGRHRLKLSVSDEQGNERTLQTTFKKL